MKFFIDFFVNNISSYPSTINYWNKIENKKLIPYLPKYKNYIEPFNQCRQIFPKSYLLNGSIDIFNYSIIKEGLISGKKIYPYIMEEDKSADIDTEDDWKKAENFILS